MTARRALTGARQVPRAVHPQVAVQRQVVVGRVGVFSGAFRVFPDEVVTMDVVDVAVAIVIDTIAGDLFGIGPKDAFQVFMQGVDAGVDDGDNNRLAF